MMRNGDALCRHPLPDRISACEPACCVARRRELARRRIAELDRRRRLAWRYVGVKGACR
jgi:hypothetical protein